MCQLNINFAFRYQSEFTPKRQINLLNRASTQKRFSKADKIGFSDVLVGLDYGDEGKGRIVDNLFASGEYQIASRFNGGPNAGHSLVDEQGEILALHSIPSAVKYKNIELYIGSGCVINPIKLLTEIKDVESRGGNYQLDDRFFISDAVTVVSPAHILLDIITGKSIGTTGNGIGMAYADQAIRQDGRKLKNIRLAEILANPKQAEQDLLASIEDIRAVPIYREMIREHLDSLKGEKPTYFGFIKAFKSQVKELIDAVMYLEQRKFINKKRSRLQNAVEGGRNVLFEGAQAIELDINGHTPFVTSSHTIPSAAYLGGDMAVKYHRKNIGVSKLVPSRVGNGPFVGEFGEIRSEEYCDKKGKLKNFKDIEPTEYDLGELFGSEDEMDVGIALRIRGKEYGASTGRPRRIGAFDLFRVANNCIDHKIDELYLTKIDCLTDYTRAKLWKGGIPIVTGYTLNGQRINHIPTSAEELRRVEPIVTVLPGFDGDLSGIRNYTDLPAGAKNLIQKIQRSTGTRVAGIGVGPKREEMIWR